MQISRGKEGRKKGRKEEDRNEIGFGEEILRKEEKIAEKRRREGAGAGGCTKVEIEVVFGFA